MVSYFPKSQHVLLHPHIRLLLLLNEIDGQQQPTFAFRISPSSATPTRLRLPISTAPPSPLLGAEVKGVPGLFQCPPD